MPYFHHFLKTILRCDLPPKPSNRKDITRRKLVSRSVREVTYKWIVDNVLESNDSLTSESKMFLALWKAYSSIIEVLVLCDFSGEDISNMPSIEHVMAECASKVYLLESSEHLDVILPLKDVAHEIYDNISRRILHSGTHNEILNQPRNLWFIWGQTLLRIARSRLTPSEDYENTDYIACIDLACNMLQRCICYVYPEHNSNINRLFAHCESGIGYAYLLKARVMSESLKGFYFNAAKDMLLRARNRKQRTLNETYNLACIYCLENNVEECKKWLEIAREEESLPPAAYLEKDPDFTNIRDCPWFLDLIKNVVHSNSSYTLPLTKIQENIDNIEDTSNDWMSDEGMKKIYDSLIGGGFTKSVVLNMVKEVYKGKTDHQMNTDALEKQKLRLQKRLLEYSMKDKSFIPSDGNCQFYSLSDQIFNTIDHHRLVRQTLVKWLRDHKEWKLENGASMKDFVHGTSWEEYCEEMSRNGIWGDHLTLTAAANYYGMKICIISSIEGDNFITEIIPTSLKSDRPILLSHYAEYHYGSITHC